MIFTFFLLLEWKCEHDKMVDYLHSLPLPKLVTVGRLKEEAKTRTPINIKYDFRLI